MMITEIVLAVGALVVAGLIVAFALRFVPQLRTRPLLRWALTLGAVWAVAWKWLELDTGPVVGALVLLATARIALAGRV